MQHPDNQPAPKVQPDDGSMPKARKLAVIALILGIITVFVAGYDPSILPGLIIALPLVGFLLYRYL